MPLLSKYSVGEGFLAVWRREESTAQLLDRLTLSGEEQTYYNTISQQPRRRKEWLTWHWMIREFLGEKVHSAYDEQGRPVLVNHSGYISVSHSSELVVLYYSQERCGMDIEDCGRHFERVSDRYISQEEWHLAGASRNNRFQALMWCVKETIYKYVGKPGPDFLRDIRVEHIDMEKREVHVLLFGDRRIRVAYRFFQQHCLAYTLSE